MDEILPGIRHWTAFRETIKMRVSSYYVEPAGMLIDPMVPEDGGLSALAQLPVRPQQIVLTNRHHRRHSSRIAETLDIPIRVAMPAMVDFGDEPHTRPFEFSDEVAPGVVALKVGKIADDETALHIQHGTGAIALGDGLVHFAGALGYFPDDLLGARPREAHDGLREKFRGMLERDFEALLFAHGEPMTKHAKTALRHFVEQPVGQPDYGSIV
jgi:hypothetical protein